MKKDYGIIRKMGRINRQYGMLEEEIAPALGGMLNWSRYVPREQWEGVITSEVYPYPIVAIDLHKHNKRKFKHRMHPHSYAYEDCRGRNVPVEARLPEELSELEDLRYVDLSFNGLNGEIPPQIATMPNLEQLIIPYNRLQGRIPAAFASSPRLDVLDARYNDFDEDPVPKELKYRATDSLCLRV